MVEIVNVPEKDALKNKNKDSGFFISISYLLI